MPTEESNLIPSGHGTRLLSVLEGQSSSLIPEGRRPSQGNGQLYPNGIRFAPSYQSQEDPNDGGLHSDGRKADESKHNGCAGDCFKSVVFGGIDGIMSSLAIISGAAGGKLSWRIVLVLGTANLVANSISTGISEFLSSKAHREFLSTERRREVWEYKHYREDEMSEMVKRFESRGMASRDAELVVSKIAQYENIFVGLMLSEELGLQLSYEDDAMLLTDAFVMFLAYACLGIVPLIIFASGPLNVFTDQNQYQLSMGISLLVLFVLGSLKSRFGSGGWFYCGLETVVLGAICAVVSYFVGDSIMSFIALT